MNVLLLRHGAAGGRILDDKEADRARRLAPEGIELVRRVALGLRKLGILPSAILTSPIERTVETALLVAPVLTPGQEPEVYDWLIENVPIKTLVSGLLGLGKDNLLAITHHDVQERFTAFIVDGHPSTRVLAMPFASGVMIDSELDMNIKAGIGHIDWAMTGEQLALLSDEPAGTVLPLKPLVATRPTLVRA